MVGIWTICTSSDGLRISDVKYNGKVVFLNAKLVDWHVSYSNTDGFGYSDAVGCPYFSNAAVVAIDHPKLKHYWNQERKLGLLWSNSFIVKVGLNLVIIIIYRGLNSIMMVE